MIWTFQLLRWNIRKRHEQNMNTFRKKQTLNIQNYCFRLWFLVVMPLILRTCLDSHHRMTWNTRSGRRFPRDIGAERPGRWRNSPSSPSSPVQLCVLSSLELLPVQGAISSLHGWHPTSSYNIRWPGTAYVRITHLPAFSTSRCLGSGKHFKLDKLWSGKKEANCLEESSNQFAIS